MTNDRERRANDKGANDESNQDEERQGIVELPGDVQPVSDSYPVFPDDTLRRLHTDEVRGGMDETPPDSD